MKVARLVGQDLQRNEPSDQRCQICDAHDRAPAELYKLRALARSDDAEEQKLLRELEEHFVRTLIHNALHRTNLSNETIRALFEDELRKRLANDNPTPHPHHKER